MTKKDRIAVVISTLVLFFVLVCFIDGKNADFQGGGVLVLFLLVCYWGYRFIQNDISFLKGKDD